MMQQQKQQDIEAEDSQEEQSITIDLSKLKESPFVFSLNVRTIDIAIFCLILPIIFTIALFIFSGKEWIFSKLSVTITVIPTVIIPFLILRTTLKKLEPSFQTFQTLQTRTFPRTQIASHLKFFIDIVSQNTGRKNEAYLMPIFQEVLEQVVCEDTVTLDPKEIRNLQNLAQRRSIRRDYPEVIQAIIAVLHKLHTEETRLFLQGLAEEKPKDTKEAWIPKAAQQCLDKWHDKFW
jgi:hypothetical protein